MRGYKPNPIDTTHVELPDELWQLTEELAGNVHEHWAKHRMQEGWTWGPERDDTARKHPNLIPYAELSESEKQYDRRVAMETLKAIIARGYNIEKG